MSLRLILGNSGSGKSHFLYQTIIEAAVRSPEKNFLVIVPEQFTMQTQMELVGMHPDGGLLNIDILSFPRLAHRVFEEVGADRRTVLEETGKTLLLRRAASKKEAELKVLKNNLKKVGYLRQMKSMISELTQYDIDPEKMGRLLGVAQKPSLFYKLQDIGILYEAFQRELEGKYITAEETLEALCQVARQSKLLRGCTVALDGFTGFTPIQQKLLAELLRLAGDVYVTVCIGAGEDFFRVRGEHELFGLSKKTIRTLTGIAREQNCEVCAPVVMEWKTLPRYQGSPALAHLEAHLFRGGRQVPFAGKSGAEGVSLHAAANPVQEAHFAARTIRSLARQGYRYRDIAVIVGDLASYGNYIPQVFGEYHIPCFMDSTRTVFSNPLIEFIRAALDMVQQDFTRVAVFRYLRAGLCRIEEKELDILENYVLAAGVRHFSAWTRPFTRRPGQITEEQFEICEKLRERICEPLLEFVPCMRAAGATARQKTEALYNLLCHYEVQNALAGYEEAFRRENQAELAREFSGIYAMVIALFDKLAELLGGEPLSLREYTELLEAGFEEARVRMVPPSADRIQVGDIERTRLQNIRVLIFLGLNDGWVPASGAGGGLLSDMERESLKESGVELAPTTRENSYIQRFYLYLNLTKPSERLYLSCSKASMDGAVLRPSYVFRSVARLFPGLSAVDEDSAGSFADRVLTPENGRTLFLDGLQQIREKEPSAQWLELYNWYRRSESFCEETEKLLEAAFLKFDESGIGRAAARELYGKLLAGSVSRLEKFASCAFAHFLQYGLGLAEREEYEFRPVDMGRILHSAIELYSRRVLEEGYDWFAVPQQVREKLTDECVAEIADQYGQQVLFDSARGAYVIERMKRIMRRTVWAFHEQIASGQFYPAGFEVSFSQVEDLEAVNIALSGEEKMKLKGRIDRIDVCEQGEQVYVKVVDYKSGNTSFDLVALYYGLQLQLVVYLNAAVQMEKRLHGGKEIVPAGIFYYHMEDPMLKVDECPDPEEINKKILKELRPDGLVNGDDAVIRAMDAGLEKSSLVIPVGRNKDGSLSKLSRTASPQQFEDLSAFVHRKMQELGRQMLEGGIAPVPYQRKQRTACDYCGFRAVCGFDEKIPGTHTKRLREYGQEEIWEKLGKREE